MSGAGARGSLSGGARCKNRFRIRPSLLGESVAEAFQLANHPDSLQSTAKGAVHIKTQAKTAEKQGVHSSEPYVEHEQIH